MATVQELISQRAALDLQIRQMMQEERQGALNRVATIMAEFGLDISDVQAYVRRSHSGVRAVKPTGPVRYRDPATGATWSGKGMKPRWLASALAQGRSITEFLIENQSKPASAISGDAAQSETRPGGTAENASDVIGNMAEPTGSTDERLAAELAALTAGTEEPAATTKGKRR